MTLLRFPFKKGGTVCEGLLTQTFAGCGYIAGRSCVAGYSLCLALENPWHYLCLPCGIFVDEMQLTDSPPC